MGAVCACADRIGPSGLGHTASCGLAGGQAVPGPPGRARHPSCRHPGQGDGARGRDHRRHRCAHPADGAGHPAAGQSASHVQARVHPRQSRGGQYDHHCRGRRGESLFRRTRVVHADRQEPGLAALLHRRHGADADGIRGPGEQYAGARFLRVRAHPVRIAWGPACRCGRGQAQFRRDRPLPGSRDDTRGRGIARRHHLFRECSRLALSSAGRIRAAGVGQERPACRHGL